MPLPRLLHQACSAALERSERRRRCERPGSTICERGPARLRCQRHMARRPGDRLALHGLITSVALAPPMPPQVGHHTGRQARPGSTGTTGINPMRQHGEITPDTSPATPPPPPPPAPAPPAPPGRATLQRLLPYLRQYPGRVAAAMAFIVGAKLANVGVPMLLKTLVDAMAIGPGAPAALLVVPVGLLLAYGGLRLCTSLCTELRELVLAKATQG